MNHEKTSRQELLMDSLILFYKDKNYMYKILPILNGKSKISLRILDWFATNYSKKKGILYDNKINEDEIVQFIVYVDYKAQLKAYSKKQFDPFCRRERILFKYGDSDKEEILTTIGQLNFFRWVLQNNILDYIKDNLKDIELDMYYSLRKNSKNPKKRFTEKIDSKKVSKTLSDNKLELEKNKDIVKGKNDDLSKIDNNNLLKVENNDIKEEKINIPKNIIKIDKNKKSILIDDLNNKHVSISATKILNKHNVKIIVNFE